MLPPRTISRCRNAPRPRVLLDMTGRPVRGGGGRRVRHDVDSAPAPRTVNPGRRVLLYTRPYIDLQRVAAALCPS
ncbi:putative leader peptide [Streptomyces sp. NPDC050145]|uniref:putative leader peptide n=1 Tax=Streptomyces sp. NPDC050145 TaxID=3365602 RepID=UPI0037AB2493